jgi:FMN-dependent NADH-azoreductase
MSQVLMITSSPRLASYSTRVAHVLADRLASRERSSTISIRDLTRQPLPRIDDSFAAARNAPPDSLTALARVSAIAA